MDPGVPAAAIERGTTARQRYIGATLGTLADRMEERGVEPPTVLIVGAVAALAERLAWREALPLSGRRVAVGRPKERAARLARMLRDVGAEVVELPCIATEGLPGPLPPIGGYAWAAFTSPTGAEALFASLARHGRDIRELGPARVAAIGPTTAEALRSRGLRVDLVPETYDGEHLAMALADAMGAAGRALLLRAEGASPELGEIFRARGVSFDEVPLYRIRPVRRSMPEGLDMAVFTCASGVRAFVACAPPRWDGLGAIAAACIGEHTARAAREAGFRRVSVASSATMEALVDATIAIVGEERPS